MHDMGRLYWIPATALNSCNEVLRKVPQFNRWKKFRALSTIPNFYNLKVMEIGFEFQSGFSQSLSPLLSPAGSPSFLVLETNLFNWVKQEKWRVEWVGWWKQHTLCFPNSASTVLSLGCPLLQEPHVLTRPPPPPRLDAHSMPSTRQPKP